MSYKLWHLPQVIAFEMFENMFTFYENISAPDVPPNISSTDSQTQVIFVFFWGEYSHKNIFFPLGKMDIGVMASGTPLENLNSRGS